MTILSHLILRMCLESMYRIRISHSYIGTHGTGTRIHFIIQKHQPEREFVQAAGSVVSMSFDGLFCWVWVLTISCSVFIDAEKRTGPSLPSGNPNPDLHLVSFLLWIPGLLPGIYIIMSVVLCYTRAQQLVPYVANGLDSYLFIFRRAAEALKAASLHSAEPNQIYRIPLLGHLQSFNGSLAFNTLTNAQPSSLADETRPTYAIVWTMNPDITILIHSHVLSISQNDGIRILTEQWITTDQ